MWGRVRYVMLCQACNESRSSVQAAPGPWCNASIVNLRREPRLSRVTRFEPSAATRWKSGWSCSCTVGSAANSDLIWCQVCTIVQMHVPRPPHGDEGGRVLSMVRRCRHSVFRAHVSRQRDRTAFIELSSFEKNVPARFRLTGTDSLSVSIETVSRRRVAADASTNGPW
jgi:hypothetical protein